MSSMRTRLKDARWIFLGGAALAVSVTAFAQREIVQPIPPGASAALPQGSADWNAASARLGQSADGEISAAYARWKALQQGDAQSFSAVSSFLMAWPGWPGEDRLRRLAEGGANPQIDSPSSIAAYFARFPARSATGHARHALALSALGRADAAREAARSAWRAGALSVQDEQAIFGQFAGALSPQDHEARADMLLWGRGNAGAERLLAWLSPNARLVSEARIAMQRGAPDATLKMQAALAAGAGHPGFIADRAAWLRDEGNALAARQLLGNREALTTRPASPEKWMEALLAAARAAASDGQWQLAYAIAHKVDDIYPAGVDVRDRPIGERDDYTSLVWLAGTTAFYELNRPRDAVAMFERYAAAARSPQTMAKGHYWAGRAALDARDAEQANRLFALAAAYPDQFHGQLARERLGQPIPSPASVPLAAASVSDAEREAFSRRPLVRAAKALGAMGNATDQGVFLRAIAAQVESESERALTADLARSIGRPDLGVMVGRKALPDGRSGYHPASFPTLTVPEGHQGNWAMIHAITRQESQFDKGAVSRAGARGLMQLMPGTARETAGKIGLSYMPGSLNSDGGYNVQLGSSYFQQMLRYYGGSYPLAVAAYNAGPGNVNRWLAANGDPRLPGADILRWIESIPIYETRNYVMRVLENAVVYDTFNPAGAAQGSRPLSRYLGKNEPG